MWLLFRHDIIICTQFSPLALLVFPWKWMVLDYFTTYLIEWMENTRDDMVLGAKPARRSAWIGMARHYINTQMMYGDTILCANERQRDYFIGMMTSLGLIPQRAYYGDPNLQYLVRLAPHGIRDGLPVHSKPVMRGVYPGVGPDDKLIIWNGGVLQWYDSLTLVEAMGRICERRGDVKLAFVGGAYPGLGMMGLGKRHLETVEMARDLGLLDRNIFFERNWIPYDEMQNYLAEADLSVCTYFDNTETRFSLRTRYIDLFWAELPLICTHGDVWAEMVDRKGLGIVVPEGDIGAVAAAIERLVDDHEFYAQCRRNLKENKASLLWDQAMDPLIGYCMFPGTGNRPKGPRFWMILRSWIRYGISRGLFFLRRRLT
jgi:glycosyltransferase involved in cell wall biosynthesis